MQKKIPDSSWLPADWDAPDNIHAGTTTRLGGVSTGSYTSFNLADHVGDSDLHVSQNRKQLISDLELPSEPVWLNQVHGNNVINIATDNKKQSADGAYSNSVNHVCVVLTADCLPVLLCDNDGKEIAAIHVGWRGYSNDIIYAAIKKFTTGPEKLMAWLGPYIHSEYYEVGPEVMHACTKLSADAARAFQPASNGHWYADLGKLVRIQLLKNGLSNINGGNFCTFRDSDYFYSYRRDGITGRIASMIWMDSF